MKVYIVCKGFDYENEEFDSCEVFRNKKKAEVRKAEMEKEYCDYVTLVENEVK